MEITRILRFEINGINLFENNEIIVDLRNRQKVYSDRNSDNLYRLFSSTYVPRLISFVGINASGKTTTLDLFYWVLSVFFCNEKLGIENTRLKGVFMHTVNIKLYYVAQDKLHYIDSKIIQEEIKRKYIFETEEIYSRPISNNFKSDDLLDISKYSYMFSRKNLEKTERFLESDKSISRLTISREDKSLIADLCFLNKEHTDLSKSVDFDKISPSIYRFLDPSIEYIKGQESLNLNSANILRRNLYAVKFYGKDEKILTLEALFSILSSGTQKGIILLSEIKYTFDNGGYVFVDEIENHFNKSIVLDIFKLFRSETINPNAATLIFSTHYTEIIDDFERNDSIFISAKSHNKLITLVNLSDILKRSDYKKSEVYFSDTYNIGTATNYSNFRDLIKYFSDGVEQESDSMPNFMYDNLQ